MARAFGRVNRIARAAQAFLASFFVILATEVGDKTFFIAAILTMRHPRLAIWSGAMGALALMTVRPRGLEAENRPASPTPSL